MRLVTFVLAIGCAGCEHGCVARWLAERGGSERSEAPSHVSEALFGTDCSDGLARCVDGTVEASRAGTVPHPCGAPGVEQEGACACAWEPVARCPAGCAAEGLEIAASPDAAADQLCRPLTPNARALLPGEAPAPEVCAAEGVACADGLVRVCDGPGLPMRPIAVCLAGCHPGIGIVHGEPATLDGTVSILCRRDHAERR